MKHRLLLLGLVIVAMPLAAYAQTFEQALVLAYEHDPSLKAERAKLRAVDEGVSQALSNWRPDLEATGEAGRDKEDIQGVNPIELKPRNASLTLTQPVFRGFRTKGSVDSAEASVLAERAALVDAEQQLLLDASKAYLDVLEAQQVLDINVKNENALQKQLVITRDRLRIGELTKTDANQAESRLKVAAASRLQAEGDLLNKQKTYARITGQMPGILLPVSLTLELPATQEEAVETAKKNNPKVIAAQYNQQAARADVRVAEGSLLPEVSLVGNAARGVDQNVTLPQRDDSFSVLAKVTVPLYRSGSDYSKSRAAIQTENQRREELEDALNKSTENATNGWQTLMTAREVISVNKEAVDATDKALYGVREEAKVGTRTTLDVLNAEQELLNARLTLSKAEHDEKIAILQLKASVGDLTAQALHLPVEQLYDPKEHYDHIRNKWIGFGT